MVALSNNDVQIYNVLSLGSACELARRALDTAGEGDKISQLPYSYSQARADALNLINNSESSADQPFYSLALTVVKDHRVADEEIAQALIAKGAILPVADLNPLTQSN